MQFCRPDRWRKEGGDRMDDENGVGEDSFVRDWSEFLDKRFIYAVVGVSSNHEKWGYKVYRELRDAGFKVYPINPSHSYIDGDRCYPKVSALPVKPDIVVTVVPPSIAYKVVEECSKLGVNRVWFQPGSESEEAIEFCRRHRIKAIYGACLVVDGLGKGFD